MAEEQQEKTPEEEATPAPRKKSPLKLIITVLGAIVVIGGVAAGAKIFMSAGGDDAEIPEPPPDAIPEFGTIVQLEEFTVNLNESAGSRYLRVRIALELEDSAMEAVIMERMPLIHDTVLLYLSGLVMEDINTVAGKELVKDQIRQRIEQHLRQGTIRRVLFEEFLVQ
ncbi:flagellar basal body-associated FliL family protein [Candidatus Sumerlaeota bacterium]|nr:flagellar basal body-associated FliL family protein [Candidatus Sumerlaeota bacterium]